MARSERTTAVAVFDNREAAEQAVAALHQAGFTDKEIGLAVHGQETDAGKHDDEGVLENTVGGAAAGGIAGGLLGAAAAGLIPGIGPIIAAGALASVLGGAAIGAGAGGLAGALGDLGVAEEEARIYEREFQAGRPIVAVTAGDRYVEASDILRDQGGHFVGTAGSTVPRGTTEAPEENAAERARRDDEQAYAVGEAGVGPARDTDDYPPPATDRGYDPSRFDLPEEEATPTYEQRVEEQADALAGRWATPTPANLYAHEMAQDPRFRGRRWTEIEQELKSGYADWARERGYQRESIWDDVKDGVRDAWHRVTGGDQETDRGQRRDADRGHAAYDLPEGSTNQESPRQGA